MPVLLHHLITVAVDAFYAFPTMVVMPREGAGWGGLLVGA